MTTITRNTKFVVTVANAPEPPDPSLPVEEDDRDEVVFYGGAASITFDAEYGTGQYWNGEDWWVLRPTEGDVTIIETTPTALGNGDTPTSTGADRVRHGSMWNWNTGSEAANSSGLSVGLGANGQGWDSNNPPASSISFNNSRGVDPAQIGSPFVASTEGAFMKAVSRPDAAIAETRPQILSDVALLTVVDEAPPPNAFRPGAHTTNKAHRWTTADVDYDLVPSGLPAPTSAPGFASALSRIGRHHIMGYLNYDTNRPFMPLNHMNKYGADNGRNIATGVLLAMTDAVTESERVRLINSVVQIGIDVFDRYNEGGRWNPLGGLYTGYKLPLVVAATLLDDAAMKAVAGINPSMSPASNSFHEDRSTWIVASGDVGRAMLSPRETYIEADVGMPEWGEQHTRQNNRDNRRISANYRAENNTTQIGAAIAATLIDGARAVWNWEPFFQYTERLAFRTFWRDDEAGNAGLRSGFGSDNYVDAFENSPRPYGSYNPVPFHVDMMRTFRDTVDDPSGEPIWDWPV